MIKNTLKKIVKTGLSIFGTHHVLRNINRHKIPVFMYHGVVKDDWNQCDGDWLQIKESDFEKQMKYLSKYYNVIPLSDIEKKSTSNKPRAVITFDDGYANNYSIAYPILQKYNLPATIFLVGNFIDTDKLFWYDKLQVLCGNIINSNDLGAFINSFKVLDPKNINAEVDNELKQISALPNYTCEYDISDVKHAYKNLSLDQIYEMQSNGLITFGNHTNNHDILTSCNNNNDIESIVACDRILEELDIGQECKLFCYPNGNYSDKHMKALSYLGTDYSVKVSGGLYENGDSYQIPRVSIGRDTDINTFKLLTAGLQRGIS